MLKKKIEINYRRANERFKRCKYCAHKKWTPASICDGQIIRSEWRCGMIGLQSSRRYGIRDDHTCDHCKPAAGKGVRHD